MQILVIEKVLYLRQLSFCPRQNIIAWEQNQFCLGRMTGNWYNVLDIYFYYGRPVGQILGEFLYFFILS